MADAPKIRWAPTLPSSWLVRLYEANAAGMIDDELLDEVGWRIWERLSDVLRVSSGRVRCPVCATDFQVWRPGCSPDEEMRCSGCDWSVSPHHWHKTWENRDLNGNCPEFPRFVQRWPTARTARDRMLLIDAVVHALHVSSRDDLPGNFAARNLLEGSRPKIVAILDELATGPGSHVAAGARQRYESARRRYHSPRVEPK